MGWKSNKDPRMSWISTRQEITKQLSADFITVSGHFYGDKFSLQDSSTQTRKFNFTWSCIIPFI